MKRAVLSKYDTLTVGEMPFLDKEEKRLEIVRSFVRIFNAGGALCAPSLPRGMRRQEST